MAEPTRHDPQVKRALTGSLEMSFLRNENPDRHYVIVSKVDRSAVAWYESMGYEYEQYTAGGVCPRGVPPGTLKKLIKDGEHIETLDGYLMSIDRKDLAAYQAAGRERMDSIDRMMTPSGGELPKGAANPLMGLPAADRGYFHLQRFGVDEGSGLKHGDAAG